MFERVIAQVDPSGLTDACGLEPSFVCEWIWDVSGNERLAEISAWGVEKPLKIVFILVGAYVANRILKKAISTVVDRLVQERSLIDEEEKSDALVARVGRRAKARLQKNRERAERSRQRAKTLGGLLSTLATLTTYSLGVLLALGEIGFDWDH